MTYPIYAWLILAAAVLGIGWVVYLMIAQKAGIWPYPKK